MTENERTDVRNVSAVSLVLKSSYLNVICRNMLERFITDELRAADKTFSKSKTLILTLHTSILQLFQSCLWPKVCGQLTDKVWLTAGVPVDLRGVGWGGGQTKLGQTFLSGAALCCVETGNKQTQTV